MGAAAAAANDNSSDAASIGAAALRREQPVNDDESVTVDPSRFRVISAEGDLQSGKSFIQTRAPTW